MCFRDLFFTVANRGVCYLQSIKTELIVNLIKYVKIYHINVLLSSIINQTNENLALTPKQARESYHTGTGRDRGSMDHMMHLTYVSFSHLSKVNLGGKVVHWTRTLVVVMSQCTTPGTKLAQNFREKRLLPAGKLGKSDSQIGRSYSAKLQHFLSI